jgi:separase
MTSTVSYHIEEAYNILRGLIPKSSTETDPKTKRSPAHAKKSPKETAPAKKPTRAASVRTTNKARVQNPVTSRSRKGLFSESLLAVLPDKVLRAALENVSNVIQRTPPKQASVTIGVQKAVIVFDLETIVGQLRKLYQVSLPNAVD